MINCSSHPFPLFSFLFGIIICFIFFEISKYISYNYISFYNEIKEENEKEKWNVKVVSTIHALFTIYGSITCLLKDEYKDIICGYTDFSSFFLAFTCGYMIYDIYVSIKAYGFTFKGVFPFLMIHHINIIICFLNALYHSLGYYFILFFMTNEISQPFLHGSWFLMKLKVKKNSLLMIINSIFLLITFIGARLFLNTWIWYWLVITTKDFNPLNPMGLGTFCGTIHLLVNYYWCYLFYQQAKDALKK